MKNRYVLSIDQSTQGTKAMLLDEQGRFLLRRDVPHRQLINDKGWVGHDAGEIAGNIALAVKEAIRDSGIDPDGIVGVAVANQRESVAVWDRSSGEPVSESIVWQCNRAAKICESIADEQTKQAIYAKTGLPLSPFFSGPKVAWILQNVPGSREKAEQGKLCVGTMDCWTIWQLTGGKVHKTDASNASRTQLFNIRTLQWDPDICAVYHIPMSCLPEVCDSDALYGETDLFGLLTRPVPIHAAIGDSHGVMFSHGCVSPGDLMCGYGSGSCVMMNTGDSPVASGSGVNTTVAWKKSGAPVYALEGVVNYSGSVVSWLNHNAGLIQSSGESSELAMEANPGDKTYMVPAFTGIGAPHWKDGATAAYVGMTRLTGRAELVRAALDSIAYQISDLVTAFCRDTGARPKEMRVAGGPSRNRYLMQFQCDILGFPVVVPEHEELSGIGAAYMAGIAMGLYDYEALIRQQKVTAFHPQMAEDLRLEKLAGWKRALGAVLQY